jgi:molecular chaperone GrpE
VTTRPEEEHKVVVRDRRRIDPVTGTAREPDPEPATDGMGIEAAPAGPTSEPAGGSAELAAARAEAAERTADLQRVTAEYANYRKRVERDKAVVVETATGAVLSVLLPVLDDIDRARAHGDLTGTFKGVADQLEATLEKLGLTAIGAVGDPFDPMLHEAVSHQTTGGGGAPTCVAVLRRGFKLGDRLLRPALVAVADPAEDEPEEPADELSPTDLPGPTDKPAARANGPEGPPGQGAGGSSPASTSTSGSARVTASADASAPRARQGGAHRAPDGDDDAEADPDGETPVAWFGEGEQPE